MFQLVKLSHVEINLVILALTELAKRKQHKASVRNEATKLATWIDAHYVLAQWRGRLP